jgi:hypothetical protein
MMSLYLSVAGVFGGFALGYMATESEISPIRNFTIALLFAAFWPLVLIVGPIFMVVSICKKILND